MSNSNLAPGVSPAHDIFFPEDEPNEIAYCEDPECGYEIDAYELRYDEDPICPNCAGAMQPERPEQGPFVIAYRDLEADAWAPAAGEPSYPTRLRAERALRIGRERFASPGAPSYRVLPLAALESGAQLSQKIDDALRALKGDR